MPIVHLHIEKTAGVTLKRVYESEYGAENCALYYVRDNIFSPFSIRLRPFWLNEIINSSFFNRRFGFVVRLIKNKRSKIRYNSRIPTDKLTNYAVIFGHFSVFELKKLLPPSENEYRTVIREPLERMWSHYHYWLQRNGDVGHRSSPVYSAKKILSFKEFAFAKELKNFQYNAIGGDPSNFTYIGVTEKLDDFVHDNFPDYSEAVADHINIGNYGLLPEFGSEFIKEFKRFHSEDYRLYDGLIN